MTPEALLALLRAHQDGVYTVCLHVLRNPHDAEDAAQEALLKIASGAKELREPRAYKTWLYRVVYRTAVDHLRRRATRRRTEEGSAAMSPAPLPDEAREAIHEAMATLPDEDALMLVEHYFEKATIEELGRREGISDVAMGKRLEKAREKLKRGLAGAGILLGASQVTHILESVIPATAPSSLISSAIVSKAALLATGGVVMGAKGYSLGIVAAMAMIFLIIGAGGGYLVGARKTASRDMPSGSTVRGTTAGGRVDRVADPSSGEGIRRKDITTDPAERSQGVAAPKSNPAVERLAQFKKWHDEWRSERWETQAEYAEHHRKLVEQGAELRQILLKDVAAFISFAKDPENAPCLYSLFSGALNQWVFQSNGQWAITGRAFTDEDVPAELTAGLIEVFSQGSEGQKLALFSFGSAAFNKPPESLLGEYRKYLEDPSAQLLLAATWGLRKARSLTSTDLEAMKRNASQSPYVGVRSESYKAIAAARTPEAFDWVFSQLQAQPDGKSTSLVASALREEIYMHDPFPKQVEPRAAEAVVTALRREVDDHAYESLLYFGLCLSTDYTGRILEVAASRAPTEALRRATEKILESFRNGERNSQRLWSEYFRSKK